MPAVPPTPELEQAAARLLLSDGLATLSFGRLSRETGVSDRMLVYRFGSKAVLVERALDVVAAGLRDQLSALVGTGPSDPASVLRVASEAMLEESRAPVLATWFEVLAGARRGDPVCAAAAERIGLGWHAWLRTVLSGEPDPDRAASELLARLEGVLVLHSAGLVTQARTAGGL